MSARIILLTNTSDVSRALARSMVLAGCAPCLIVRESSEEHATYSWPSRVARSLFGHARVDRVARLRHSRELHDMLAWEQATLKASNLWLKEAAAELMQGTEWPAGIPVLDTVSVNADHVVDRVRQERPDLLVVFGTGMLHRPLLAIPTRGAVNSHSSLLPHYRGVRSEFWQCYNDDPRYVGITIHQVDPGVDSGHILFQLPTRSTWPSDPYRLRAVNTLATLTHYPRTILDFLAGRITPVPQGPTEMKTNLKRDMTLELRIALKERIAG